MRNAKRILLTCASMIAVVASARAADLPTTKPAPVVPPTVAGCASVHDVLFSDCPLTWYGVTLYGAYDAGVGWVSHGLPENGYNYEGESLVNRNGNHSQFLFAQNNLQQT